MLRKEPNRAKKKAVQKSMASGTGKSKKSEGQTKGKSEKDPKGKAGQFTGEGEAPLTIRK